MIYLGSSRSKDILVSPKVNDDSMDSIMNLLAEKKNRKNSKKLNSLFSNYLLDIGSNNFEQVFGLINDIKDNSSSFEHFLNQGFYETNTKPWEF